MTDEPVLGDLDEVALPELTDSVWMRLLANALDPDAAPADAALIPVDLPPDSTAPEDDIATWDDWPDVDADDASPSDDAAPDDSGSSAHDYAYDHPADWAGDTAGDAPWHTADDPYSDPG